MSSELTVTPLILLLLNDGYEIIIYYHFILSLTLFFIAYSRKLPMVTYLGQGAPIIPVFFCCNLVFSIWFLQKKFNDRVTLFKYLGEHLATVNCFFFCVKIYFKITFLISLYVLINNLSVFFK